MKRRMQQTTTAVYTKNRKTGMISHSPNGVQYKLHFLGYGFRCCKRLLTPAV